jgi:ABC-2 type transport system permease protein
VKTLRYLLEKEIKQFTRNAFLPKMLVAFPTLMLFLLPWAADPSIDNINVALVDRDASPRSARLARAIESTGDFRVTSFPPVYPLALEQITTGAADIILDIPPRLERDALREGTATFLLAPNGVNGTRGGLAAAYLSALLERQPDAPAPPLEVSVHARFNPRGDYKPFMVPGLMAMLLVLLCGFLPALNIVSEKERGTIEQVNVTPVNRFTFIAAKLIPYWTIGLLVLAYCILLARLVYGHAPAGSIATIYLVAIVFVSGAAGMGLIVSNHSSTMQQAMFVMFFILILFLLMSGFFTPVESMPAWARWIAALNPLKYFIQALRAVYLKGSSTADLLSPLSALTLFSFITITWAVLGYRKSR